MTQRAVVVGLSLLALFWCPVSHADNTALARIDTFLQRNQAKHAINGLSPAEKIKLGQTLALSNRTVSDRLISRLLNNPVAWEPGPHGREMLRSVIDALPHVAAIPGAEHALANACHPNESNFRGFGFELIASAALMRYREPDGCRPRVVRMSAEVRGADGVMRESDGCAVFDGADQLQRLVTMKSVRSEGALHRSVHKASSQLALRNGSQDPRPGAQIQPGVMMLGYTDPAVLRSAQGKDWKAAANRTGAKLLVLAVNQLTGEVTKLASEAATTPAPRYTQRQRPSWSDGPRRQAQAGSFQFRPRLGSLRAGPSVGGPRRLVGGWAPFRSSYPYKASSSSPKRK